jgi:PAS domain S-box-containing protein
MPGSSLSVLILGISAPNSLWLTDSKAPPAFPDRLSTSAVLATVSASASGLGVTWLLAFVGVAVLTVAGVCYVSRRQARRQTSEIQEERNLLATLLDHLPDNVYVKNLEGRYLLTNRAHARFHGAASPAHFKGKLGRHLFAQPVAQAYSQSDAKVLLGSTERFDCEETVVDGRGSPRLLSTTKVPLKDSSGKVLGLVGFSRDITEPRRADEALRDSEARFRAIWEHSIDGMLLRDAQGIIVGVNEAFCQLVKQPREKLMNQPFSTAYTTHTPTSPLSAYKTLFAEAKILPRTTEKITLSNGEDKDVELSSCFVELGRNGRAVLSIFRDVSERRRVEAVVAYERDLLTTLFDNLPDALYFKDLQSRFVRVSKSKLESAWAMALARHKAAATHESLNSTSPSIPEATPIAAHLQSLDAFAEFIIGKTDFDFFDEARARSAYEDEQQIIRTGLPLIGKVEAAAHPDGSVTWSLSSKMPWYNRDGQIIGTFGVSKNITQIKEAEASVKLVHQQLVDASRQAGMAEVATGVLHNVGNVLNSVNVSATLLADKLAQSRAASLSRVAALLGEHSQDLGRFMVDDARGRRLPQFLEQLAGCLAQDQAALLAEVRCLATNIEHIKTIVAMQQTYARRIGVAESVKPRELVEDALRINSSSLARQHVQVRREYATDLPEVMMDKHKVLQILVNMMNNAGHACAQSPRNDRCLTIRLEGAGTLLRLSVSDNGVGIAPENLSRIFNLGFTTRPDGHGFGLHAGALAARELGGCLRSHSDGPGRGATFTLELPMTVTAPH